MRSIKPVYLCFKVESDVPAGGDRQDGAIYSGPNNKVLYNNLGKSRNLESSQT
jgi:hypothetical protein